MSHTHSHTHKARVSDTPAAAAHGQHAAGDVADDIQVVSSPPRRNAVMAALQPLLDVAWRTSRGYVEWADEKLPKIRGRPAISELIANLKPGITVSLVSLPLSISLAIAADATPVQGIITAAWSGLVSAFFGGSHYNVVGPTGALSGILSEFSVRYGSSIQPLLAILAGALSLLVWVLRLERFFAFIPGAVMHGFTLGVAFIISLNQLNFALGLTGLPRHERFLSNLYESINNLDRTNWFALVFFIVSFTLLFNLQKKFGKIPWSIVLALVGIIIGIAQDSMGWTTKLATIQSNYKNLQLSLIKISDVFVYGLDEPLDTWIHLMQGAVSIAVVAVLETLISAHIADRMTKTLFNDRKEVLAVGLANIASGAAGGIPATAALARTALNIKSGATSRAAGIVNGISIILLSTVLFDLFKYLPLPVVASILVNVAFRMVEWHEVKLLFAMDKRGFVVAILSGLICVVEDPTAGIIYGAFFAMINLLTQLRHAHATLRIYRGYKCEMHYLFDDVSDIKKTVSRARAKFLGEPTEEDLEAESTPTSKPAHAAVHPGATASRAGGRRDSVAELDFEMEPHARDPHLPRIAMYSLPGYFVYPSVQAHRDRIRALFMEGQKSMPDIDVVVFNLKETYYGDADALDAIGTLVDELRRAGKQVYMLGFHTRVEKMLRVTHWFEHVHSFIDFRALIKFLREPPAEHGDQETGKAVHAIMPAGPTSTTAHGAKSVITPASAPSVFPPEEDVLTSPARGAAGHTPHTAAGSVPGSTTSLRGATVASSEFEWSEEAPNTRSRF